MEKEKALKQNKEYGVNAWGVADDILLEVCMVQDVQKVYFDEILNLSFAEGAKEDTLRRIVMLDFLGEAILRHMEEIQNGLVTLMPLIRALQNDIK